MATIEEKMTAILEFLCRAPVDQYGWGDKVMADEIAHGTGLSAGAINRAVELLGERRHIRIYEDASSLPFEFAAVELTTAGRETADSTIKRDAGLILAFVSGQTHDVTGVEIEAGTGLTPARVNHGVDYLDWRGYLSRSRCLGTAAYTFKSVHATASGERRLGRSSSPREAECALSSVS